MRSSLRIARIAGIDIFVHATFLIIVAWAAFLGWSSGGTLGAVFWSTAFVLSLFVCVVLHELGHSLAARRYGIGTRDITLLPIGGVARLERMPDNPWHEIVVALAGPAVNIAIAIGLSVWLSLTGGLGSALLQPLLLVNLVLVAFNMIPAFPLDGGRVLRAALALRMEYARATSVAARIGQGFAILFGIVGLFSNIFLVLIAVFIWFAGAAEARAVRLRSVLGNATVGDAMLTSFRALDVGDPIGDAINLARSGLQRDFPVVIDGVLAGLVRSQDLLDEPHLDSPVHTVMQREIMTLQSTERLRDVLPRLAAAGTDAVPVVWRGYLTGLLTQEAIHRFIQMSTMRRGTPPRIRPALARY